MIRCKETASLFQSAKDILESGQKRKTAMHLRQEYPIATLCEVLNYPRSPVYYEAQPATDETEIKAAIVKLCGQHPTYSYRRLTAMLNGRVMKLTTSEWFD